MKDELKDDSVSRKAVSDAMYNLCSTDGNNPYRDNPHIDVIQDAILNLPSVSAVDVDKVIKKLNGRIDEFIKKHPGKKDCAEVQIIREFIQMLEREG